MCPPGAGQAWSPAPPPNSADLSCLLLLAEGLGRDWARLRRWFIVHNFTVHVLKYITFLIPELRDLLQLTVDQLRDERDAVLE